MCVCACGWRVRGGGREEEGRGGERRREVRGIGEACTNRSNIVCSRATRESSNKQLSEGCGRGAVRSRGLVVLPNSSSGGPGGPVVRSGPPFSALTPPSEPSHLRGDRLRWTSSATPPNISRFFSFCRSEFSFFGAVVVLVVLVDEGNRLDDGTSLLGSLLAEKPLFPSARRTRNEAGLS